MLSPEKYKEIMGDSLSTQEALKLQESISAICDAVLDTYLEKFVNINICKNQLSTVESLQGGKVQKVMDWKAKNIVAENMLSKKVMK